MGMVLVTESMQRLLVQKHHFKVPTSKTPILWFRVGEREREKSRA